MTIRGVGIDVADVRRVARLLDLHGDRFVQRWFTPGEVAECSASACPARAYAERFAAKEAVWKALGLYWHGSLPWRRVCVVAGGSDRGVEVTLLDEVARAAERVGVGSVTVSWSAAGEIVTAVAVASLI